MSPRETSWNILRNLLILFFVMKQAAGDLYMHNPRGSNNRLDEKSANRKNGNRLFDSQNNNRGGYNVGDAKSTPFGTQQENQYRMKYFQSSVASRSSDSGRSQLVIEWTNQHGCGGNEGDDPHKLNCNIVIQFMCQPESQCSGATGTKDQDCLRDGSSTSTPDYTSVSSKDEPESAVKRAARRAGDVKLERGNHEPWGFYDQCYQRQRNEGNRRGYECPEERDYYPYWHSSPWKDAAILAPNATVCPWFQQHSFNTRGYHECRGSSSQHSVYNTKSGCESNGGAWMLVHNYLEKAPAYATKATCEAASTQTVRYIWAVPHDSPHPATAECLVALEMPECKQADWTRSNHLGNGRDGVPNNYTWTLPHFPSATAQRCVLRMRYNISTDDYDPYNTNANNNSYSNGKYGGPIQQNPYVDVGASSPLRLAINTAQFGRTFQDRSHVFQLLPRPSAAGDSLIHNLNVRGKRGNIVQTYPAVEYDFIPNRMEIKPQDLVHIQWTGSNTHNNGAPAGDGQAGNDGEGKAGTDRSNLVQSLAEADNYPVPFDNTEAATLCRNVEVVWNGLGPKTAMKPEDICVILASAGYYQCLSKDDCSDSVETKAAMSDVLDNAPASFPGLLLRVKQGVYTYICSRNNNFSNRSQKGRLHVAQP